LPAANIGTAYSQTLTAVGGAGGYTWAVTSGSLPVAITLNAATGALSGTPQSSAQNATFTVTATDKNSATVSAQLTLAVKLAITTSSPLANGALNAQYNQTLTGEGGLAPYSWSVTSGSLPAGLTLSAAGAITGAPSAAGTFTFTVQLADSATPADTPVTKQFVITIGNGLTITTAQTLPNATVGVSYTQPLAATGGAPPYGWALTTGSAPLPAPLTLNANGTITGTPTAPSVTTFSVTVTDSASTTASQQFTLTVVSPPLITTNSLPDGTVGVSYSQTLAATAGTSPYSWALSGGSLPTGLTLSSAGAISGKPSVPGMASFSVKLTDATGVTATRALSITIASSLSITSPAALPGAIFNVVYSDLLQATGGTMPYTWKVTGGSLPAALSLQANGTIAGLPTAVGSFSFTAQVTDSVNAKASAQFSLTVSSGLTITTSTLPGSAVGAAYSQTLAAGGGTAPYTWSIAVGALPGGLTLTSTGSITGTAAAAGTFTFTVQVKDNTGATAAKQLSIAVTSGLTITTPAALPAAPLNGAYSKLLAATGGAPPYTWAVSGGALPTGLTLGATTGAISGTATVSGPFSFTVTVTDSASATASQQFTLTVIGQLSVTPPLLKGAVRGTYNQPLAATGGAPPYTFAITSGTLPPGITLAGSTLGGKFVSVGDFTFTIQVTDSANATASQSFTIVVSVLTINPAVLPGAVVGTAYTTALTANNGTPPYAWSVTQGALPAGLTLDPAAGTISGTPTAASTANFMIQVVDSTNASGVQPYSLTVAGAITASYTGISGTAGSDEQLSGALTLGAPSTEAITGTLTLSFQPDASLSSPAVDPSIQFATSGTTVPIDIRASTTAQQFSLQTGTVAGTITLTVTSWQVSGVSVTPPAALTQSIQIAKAVPVISAVTATATPSGFQVVITGYSNTREVSQANLQFTAAAGQNLTTTSLTVPLTSAAATWFSGSASDQFGSQFILTLPFTVSNGAASAISSVSVQLVNSQGTSTSASATL
ncbi:MAG TPA: putative Ig domain-containing protein, partial [Bryobacteraceae bacterium]|nr:putative Ig domain-containing protein [Bryobacteraceae bacterium]